MNAREVICIGEALVDSIVSQTESKRRNFLGGAPANVATALSKLKIKPSFIGNIGNDTFGTEFLHLFKKLDIDTTLLHIDRKYKTRIVEVARDKDGDRSFIGFAKNKFDFYADENLDSDWLKSNVNFLKNMYSQAKFIITGTILLASIKSAESIYYLLNLAEQFELKIVIDLNWREVFWNKSSSHKLNERIDPIDKIMDFLSFANILKLSKEEADIFFKNKSPHQISRSFPKSPDVIITDGGDPILWYINGFEGISDFKYPGKIIDTTGAGDAFLAGLVSQILYLKKTNTKSEIQKAVKFASLCGFLTCKGEGAIEPQPFYERVHESIDFL